VASVTRKWSDVTPSLSARPNKPPKKYSAGHTSCICVFCVGSKLKAASLANGPWFWRFAKYISPNTSRQLHLANYASTITPRQSRHASRGLGPANTPRQLYLAARPKILHLASRVTTIAIFQMRLANYASTITSRQLRLDNGVSTITSRHRQRRQRLEV